MFIKPPSLINCVFMHLCVPSVLSVARRLCQPQPGSYSLLHLHPAVHLHNLLSTRQVCVCVCGFKMRFVLVSLLNYHLLYSSDSSSPNHQADPGSHGTSEVSLHSSHLYELVEKVNNVRFFNKELETGVDFDIIIIEPTMENNC